MIENDLIYKILIYSSVQKLFHDFVCLVRNVSINLKEHAFFKFKAIENEIPKNNKALL